MNGNNFTSYRLNSILKDVITLTITKNNGFELIEFIYTKEVEINSYQPLAGSFAIIKCEGKTLICYNNWRNQWEIPAGQRKTMVPRRNVL